MTIEFDKDGNSLDAGWVTVYNTAPVTNEYILKSEEYLQIGVGIPAHSYIDEPPIAKVGFAICRTTDKKTWEYVADHRGETRYSTTTKTEILIKELGDYPANTTDKAPDKFDKWNGNSWVIDEEAKSTAAIQAATLKKAELKAIADSEIDWRQDAMDGNYAEGNEATELAAWKKYRVLLMRIDTSKAPNITWPVAPGTILTEA